MEGYLQFYDDGCTFHNPPGDLPGLEAIRAFYREFWTAFPGNHLALEDVFGEGDRVACRFRVRVMHQGGFMGIPRPAGK